tara:strand:+ start:1450 stop:2028 length:579 start_codon:yes stop_codon:yes gene_type:complete
MDKSARRKDCFEKLSSLDKGTKSDYSEQIVSHLSKSEVFRKATSVFTYCAMPSEPDLADLFDQSPEKSWAFSRVDETGLLSFHRVDDAEQLKNGPFGFAEPDPVRCPLIEPTQADLILVPGVGFTETTGARLGRGKGHYDRFLELALSKDPAPAVVGVCFSIQFCDLEPEPHDIPMTSLICESGWKLPHRSK